MHKIHPEKSNKISTKIFFKYGRFCTICLLESRTEDDTAVNGEDEA